MRRLLLHARRNAIAYVALFVALGGTSYAAIKLPRNSVGTAQLRDRAVTGAKVRNASLTLADLAPGARLAGPRGAAGSVGPPGPQGQAGATGAPGTTIAAHPRLAFQTTTQNPADNPTLVPLADATWTTPAGAIDTVVLGVTISRTPSCSNPAGFIGANWKVDTAPTNQAAGFGVTYSDVPANTPTTFASSGQQLILPPPETATPRTLTLTVQDPCGDSNITVTDVRAAVVRAQ